MAATACLTLALFVCLAATAKQVLCCDELGLKHQVMMCERQHEYRLQIIVESNSKDKTSAICCAGYQFVDCVMEMVNDENCTEHVRDVIALDVVFMNYTSCQTFVRDSCAKPHCRQGDYSHLGAYCHDVYNEKIIHVLEDPEIHNKSETLCCALATKGRCLLNAMVESECEGLPLDLPQPSGLTETYGHCDLFRYLDCNGAAFPVGHWSAVLVAVFGVLLVNTDTSIH